MALFSHLMWPLNFHATRHTTIMTILHRLGEKGFVTRLRVRRSFSDVASESLASFNVKTMHDTLELAHDRGAVLDACVALSTHED
jgi:predicted transcriptional regulator